MSGPTDMKAAIPRCGPSCVRDHRQSSFSEPRGVPGLLDSTRQLPIEIAPMRTASTAQIKLAVWHVDVKSCTQSLVVKPMSAVVSSKHVHQMQKMHIRPPAARMIRVSVGMMAMSTMEALTIFRLRI
eukprot:6193453-Pleurochrysis_carterae.AAC.1